MSAAPARGPGRPRSTAIDAAILDATVDELIERGYIAMSIESVATRAAVAKTTVYRRWASTEDLALAAIRHRHGDVPDLDPDDPPRAQLLTLLDSMRRAWADERYAALVRRVAADATIKPEVYRATRSRLIRPQIAAMNAALRRAVDGGLIRGDVDLGWVRKMLTAPIMTAALTLRPPVTREQLEFTVDTVLTGLAPRAQ